MEKSEEHPMYFTLQSLLLNSKFSIMMLVLRASKLSTVPIVYIKFVQGEKSQNTMFKLNSRNSSRQTKCILSFQFLCFMCTHLTKDCAIGAQEWRLATIQVTVMPNLAISFRITKESLVPLLLAVERRNRNSIQSGVIDSWTSWIWSWFRTG